MSKQAGNQRQFLGLTDVKIDRSTPQKEAASKIEKAFHQRMLRAYLKGASMFRFNGNFYMVLQQYNNSTN